ncbi:MAG: L-ribulose-5-phosphate 3-epimerase [Rhodoferax sp.]|nr:L-ribulose-5-phosphate 3-epimerase [Rhodoferax sp.]MCF8208050.1 L-ribulose-5-phosphate 3-epimerase [Rhodoferax sp.]
MKNPVGIYEKALPKDLSWAQRFRVAREAGYDFLEISVDETPERMARLDWTMAERLAFFAAAREEGMVVPSMCLSGHRKIPFGSADATVREQAARFMEKAIGFASDTGIRVIQLAGYDVYYEPGTHDSRQRYLEGMQRALEVAAQHQVMLALEIMDTTFLNSISKFLVLKEQLPSPWFQVYPDLGNLTAWGNDVVRELTLGIHHIVGVHVKETLPVGPNFAGAFRDIPFGQGSVDFVICFKTLHALGYAGPFLVEMWTEKSDDPIQEIRAARQWVGERLQHGGFV